jgi:parvulin-like peptidyl-prolyl isomerase
MPLLSPSPDRRRPRALLALALGLVATPARPEIIERVVAKVNGEILTLSEFEARQVAAIQAERVAPESVERFLRENNQRLLQEAIDDLLILQRATELGIRVRTDYVEDAIEQIKREQNITTEEAFQGQLKREGLTLDELKRSIARSIARRQVLVRELESRTNVTEGEIVAEFQAHKADYAQPASVRLAEILVQGDDARARAEDLVARAKAGEDFAALAREHSRSATAADGGELGRVVRDDMAPELATVVFALEAGGISEPLATADGYRVLKVLERNDAKPPSLDTARPVIQQRLARERMAQQYESYIEGLRKSAGAVEVRVREVPLQVQVPTKPALSAPAEPKAPGAGDDEEIVTSPQDKPERVAPEPAPGASPRPEPTPPPQA